MRIVKPLVFLLLLVYGGEHDDGTSGETVVASCRDNAKVIGLRTKRLGARASSVICDDGENGLSG
jgi:hypothetical protein